MANTFRLLIVDDVHELLLKKLAVVPGLELDYRPFLAPSEVIEALKTAHGLVIRSKIQLSGQVLAMAAGLRFIARAGAGMDNIDEGAARELGIRLFNAPEGNRQAVAEHVLAMLLMLFNQLRQADAQVRQGIWEREANRGLELSGKTVGIIGYGHNGSATAELLAAVGCKVLAYDKYKTGFGNAQVHESRMERLFEEADILSLHIPLTSETRGMINSAFLGAFAKPIRLVNAARGEIVVLSDLAAALDNGQVQGVCLDVLENEKPENWNPVIMNRLFAHPHVVFSPHVAGWTVESYRKISEVLANKLLHEFFVHSD
ncbi:MAG: NAD(P)-dependent oxidoreductase [Bacteroidia bacterium]